MTALHTKPGEPKTSSQEIRTGTDGFRVIYDDTPSAIQVGDETTAIEFMLPL